MNIKFPAKKTRPLTPPSEAPPLAALEKTGPLQIDVACIEPHPDNPREEFDERELQALAASMETLTLMQPVQLTRAPGASERFQLIAGERRWRAAQLAGWKTIPAYVVKADARIVVEMMVDENLQHKELSPIETARAVDLLTRPPAKGGAGKTHAQAAEKFGKTASWATNLLRVLALPEGWKVRIATGEITVREARALASFAERPDVLAAVDLDRKTNPDDWHTSEDFERQLKFIAQRLDGLTAAPAAAAESSDDAGTGEAEEEEETNIPQGTMRVLPRSLPAPAGKPGAAAAALAVTPQEALRMIVELLERLTDLEELGRAHEAIAARINALRKPVRRKPSQPSHKDN